MAGADIVFAGALAEASQGRLDQPALNRRRLVKPEGLEKIPAAEFQLAHAAAADQFGQIPAGEFVPHLTVPRLAEEVVGGLQFLAEKSAHVVVVDAGAVGRMPAESLERRPEHERHLSFPNNVDEFLRGERHPGPAHFGRRHRHRYRVRPHHFANPVGELAAACHPIGIGDRSPSRFHQRVDGVWPVADRSRTDGGAHLAVVDGKRQSRSDEIDKIVDDQIAEGGGEQFVAKLGLADNSDFSTVPPLRVFPGQNRDRDAHEVKGIAGRIGGVIAFVDAPQFVEMADIV